MPTLLSSLLERKSKLKDTMSPQERHKALLDLGEAIIITLEGMLFGEYKASGEIIENIERGFYNCATRAPSLGVHWGFVRDLAKKLNSSLTSEIMSTKQKNAAAGEAVFIFKRLKESILNEDKSLRITDNFKSVIAERYKGQSPSGANFIDFFDNVFISARNIYAHPDQVIKKTGEMVHWPMGEDYCQFINPILEKTLEAFLDELNSLNGYAIGTVTNESCGEGNITYDITMPQGLSLPCLKVTVGPDEDFSSDADYIISVPEKCIYVQNYKQVPGVNTDIAEKIVRDEKKKQTLPILKSMIEECLMDNDIDSSELFTLKLASQAGYFESDELMKLIGDVRQKKGLTRDFEIIEKDALVDSSARFTPWWMIYFTLRHYFEDASTVEKGGADTFGTRTFAHRYLFQEFQSYLQEIIESSLNKEDGDSWALDSNKWQQGRLTGYLWNRIFQSRSPIGGALSATVLLWEDENHQDKPVSLVTVLSVARNIIQEIIDGCDPDMKLLQKYSELIKELVHDNTTDFVEMEKKLGVFRIDLTPRYILDIDLLKAEFISKDLPAMRISVEQLMTDMDFYFQHFFVTRLGLPAIRPEHIFDQQINVEQFLKVGLKLFSVPIEKLTDYAIEKGISLEKAKRANQRYAIAKSELQHMFIASVKQVAATEAQKFDSTIVELYNNADDLGLRFCDAHRILEEETDGRDTWCSDILTTSELDPTVMEKADDMLDFIVPKLIDRLPNWKAKTGSCQNRQSLMDKSEIYGTSGGITDSEFSALAVGINWKRNHGNSANLIVRLSFKKKDINVSKLTINRFAASMFPEWKLVNNDGTPRYLAEYGNSVGYLQAQYPVIWPLQDSESEQKLLELIEILSPLLLETESDISR